MPGRRGRYVPRGVAATGPPPCASPGAGGGSPNEISEWYVERVSDQQQMVDERRVRALLDPVDRFPVEVGQFAELFLAQALCRPGGADVVPDLTAAGENPVGQRIGWHPYTLAAGLIIVCTIVGTSRERFLPRAQDLL